MSDWEILRSERRGRRGLRSCIVDEDDLRVGRVCEERIGSEWRASRNARTRIREGMICEKGRCHRLDAVE